MDESTVAPQWERVDLPILLWARENEPNLSVPQVELIANALNLLPEEVVAGLDRLKGERYLQFKYYTPSGAVWAPETRGIQNLKVRKRGQHILDDRRTTSD